MSPIAGQTMAGHHSIPGLAILHVAEAIAGQPIADHHATKAIAGQAGASQMMHLLGFWTTCCSSIPSHFPNFLAFFSWGHFLARHCSQELVQAPPQSIMGSG